MTGPVLLDLSSAFAIEVEAFDTLLDAWTVHSDRISRLGILLSFEHWALIGTPVMQRLVQLQLKGTAAQIFYSEQALNGGVRGWFANGEHLHNVGEVIEARVRDRAIPQRQTRQRTLEAIHDLLSALPEPQATPEMFASASVLAIAFASPDHALRFADVALAHFTGESSIARLRALRAQGAALICTGELARGEQSLRVAARDAITLREPVEFASIMSQIGMIALNHDDGQRAAIYFRCALEALPEGAWAGQTASLHHNLAVALTLTRELFEAEMHAIKALVYRRAASELTEDDEDLLARIRNQHN